MWRLSGPWFCSSDSKSVSVQAKYIICFWAPNSGSGSGSLRNNEKRSFSGRGWAAFNYRGTFGWRQDCFWQCDPIKQLTDGMCQLRFEKSGCSASLRVLCECCSLHAGRPLQIRILDKLVHKTRAIITNCRIQVAVIASACRHSRLCYRPVAEVRPKD